MTGRHRIIMNISKVRKIAIALSEKEMNAIEDNFFCELNREQYMKIRPLLRRVWRKLCKEMGKYNKV